MDCRPILPSSRIHFLVVVLLLVCGLLPSFGWSWSPPPSSASLRSSCRPAPSGVRPFSFQQLPRYASPDFMIPEENDDDSNRLSDEELEATVLDWDDKVARFNTVHLSGRIGNDPEPRYLDEGKVVVNLSLACRRKYVGMERKFLNIVSGEEETDWYGLEIWGQTAEFVSKFVDKGMRVAVVGTLQVDQWIDKETQEPRNKAKVVVRDFDIMETRAESEARRNGRRGPSMYTSDSSSSSGGYGGGGGGQSSAGTGGFFDN